MNADSEIARLRALTGAKWARFNGDVIPAWVADMDLPTAPPIIEALRTLVDASDFGYNAASFDDSVVHAWADWSERRFAWRPDPGRSRKFSNALQPIAASLNVATQPGDGVVLFTPIYPPFFDLIEKAGRRIVECPLAEDGWRIDIDILESLVDDTTRAVLVCNPHNPSGRVLDAQEFAALASIAEERDLLVISDEIWQDLTYPGARHTPFATLGDEAAARTVTITSASKSFSLGGLGCAVAHFGSPHVLEALDALPPHLLGGVSATAALAAIAAWREGEPWLEETLTLLQANRDHLAERLAAELPQVGFTTPEATYLAWLDFRPLGLPKDPAKFLLEEARVALSPGPDFGAPGAGFARLNFGTTPEILDEIVDRMVRVLG
ncbi:MAG: aminotransferase class I/II-fold pyridoxal phosphate-dependent enzyme [Coriobacteriia bacterium]|nr:aminotransferase class I/II-fold pyridoxal phosphate-dependent enzyme [Coriobacteriia bacterium]